MALAKTSSVASMYALLSISFWGISFVSTKAVLTTLDPLTLLVLRFGIGALFLFLLIIAQRTSLRIRLTYLPHLLILGILGVFVHQLIQASALLTIDASAAGWMISFSPIFTVALSILFLHERVTIWKVGGMLLAATGVLLITTAGPDRTLSLGFHIGYILMLLSTLNWAVYSILLKKLQIPMPSLVITFYMCTIGFLLTLPFMIRDKGWEALPLLSQSEWIHLLFLGVFVSGVSYWFWAKSLEVMEASKVSAFLYLEPLTTLIAAVLLLNEQILFISVLGGVIIIVGVILVNRPI
ncbi:DMT family transporter [Alkalicoccobacillus murimartini]|uniref:Drug/metabolite transporter (DMT)-like permease n=1 Tax=Alkalicoccobacillus murimartini TaxID=171685 RepID=A0ABT9YIC4_9BACI|nr:DMT family transporter [Alkalicoccobacillus murimartini]MDQ0207271.1 drug/metabolite transporter (DMT)-like permease [Alkalicoccobacillus murimartini]